jgi:hypothetical protein
VSTPGLLEQWAATVLHEGIVLSAVVQDCLNRGLPPRQAQVAVQAALASAAKTDDLAGRFGNHFDDFRNWVQRVAINHVLLEQWSARVLREGIGIGAVFRECSNRGLPPRQALDMAQDAVQRALARAAEIDDLTGRFGNDFGYFRNWVRRVAINHVRSVFRRPRESLLPEGYDVTAPSKELVELVREFLQELTEEERDLLMLPYEEDLTLDELVRRYLPPDDRTENARRLVIWRRLRDIKERLREWLRENGMGPEGE